MGARKERCLFLGIVVDAQLQKILDGSDRGMKQYFSDTRFLQVMRLKGNRYIGKALHDGFPSAQLGDVARNIYSIIGKLDPGRKVKEKDIRLYSLDDKKNEAAKAD